MATMNTSQRIPILVEAFLADGTTPAVVQGVVWATSDATVVTADMDAANNMTGFATAVVAGGPARVTITGDADLGAGVITLSVVTEDITVTQDPATQAQTLRVTLAAPVAKA